MRRLLYLLGMQAYCFLVDEEVVEKESYSAQDLEEGRHEDHGLLSLLQHHIRPSWPLTSPVAQLLLSTKLLYRFFALTP